MNISDFKNPISGDKGNLLSLKDWKENILGVGFFILVVVMGQKFAGYMARKAPGGYLSDKITNPVVSVASGPSYRMYGVS